MREVARCRVFFSRQGLACERCGELFDGSVVVKEGVDLIRDFQRRELVASLCLP